MTKRKERAAPPPRADGWDCRCATSEGASGWDELCAAAPANMRAAWEQITKDPRQRNERQHPLKGSLGKRLIDGKEFEQWQYEVTAAGRLWYCIDDSKRTVWITTASVGHPKATE